MALYKEEKYVKKSDDKAFDTTFNPGQAPEHSGIYRCTGCGHEVVAEQSRQLPPQNHHQHTTSQGPIRWKMLVYAQHQA